MTIEYLVTYTINEEKKSNMHSLSRSTCRNNRVVKHKRTMNNISNCSTIVVFAFMTNFFTESEVEKIGVKYIFAYVKTILF